MSRWLAKIPLRGTKTVIVTADTKQEAERKLKEKKGEDIEPVECIIDEIGVGELVKEL